MTDNNSLPESLKLKNQLCFALYVCSKEVIRRYKPLLEPYGLTYTSYIALMALWEQDDITVKELGTRLYLDSGTLTPLLKKMENQGFIYRTRGVQNERNVYLTLTEKGRNLQYEMKNVPDEMCSLIIRDRDDLKSLLEALHEFMEGR